MDLYVCSTVPDFTAVFIASLEEETWQLRTVAATPSMAMQDVRVGIPSMRWETREPFDEDVSPSEPVLPPIAWVDGWTMCSFVTGRCWEIDSIDSHFRTFPTFSISQIQQDPTQKTHDSYQSILFDQH